MHLRLIVHSIASEQVIPEERYNDWDAESGDELEANSSEIEDEKSSISENDETPNKIKSTPHLKLHPFFANEVLSSFSCHQEGSDRKGPSSCTSHGL
jgi:hypothetical protein